MRHRNVGEYGARMIARGFALMRGIAICVQEADGDRFDAIRGQARAASRTFVAVERRHRRCRRGPCVPPLRGGGGGAPTDREFAGTGRRCRSAARCPSPGCREIRRVVIRPSRAPLRSINALVTSVVPCTISPMSASVTLAASSISARPASAPTDGSCGVVRHLCRRISLRAVSSRMKSVKVPPMSKPIR